ncbi:hypothetical protein EVAR_11545_1 [Eumeta japonica]|uniref:Uncharacterized protein n=1 Tax=Eumeta variegata TaxID=151549 RepID=A0A4C1TYT3_EUMVA|nr:hypothetical protein EVAR_11545_1 [Eumeta japonica]
MQRKLWSDVWMPKSRNEMFCSMLPLFWRLAATSPTGFNSETRSDAEPQPGPSKRLRTGSSNLENHRGLCLLGIPRKNAPLDSTSWVVGKRVNI